MQKGALRTTLATPGAVLAQLLQLLLGQLQRIESCRHAGARTALTRPPRLPTRAARTH
jgi:hypothetical protein